MSGPGKGGGGAGTFRKFKFKSPAMAGQQIHLIVESPEGMINQPLPVDEQGNAHFEQPLNNVTSVSVLNERGSALPTTNNAMADLPNCELDQEEQGFTWTSFQ